MSYIYYIEEREIMYMQRQQTKLFGKKNVHKDLPPAVRLTLYFSIILDASLREHQFEMIV